MVNLVDGHLVIVESHTRTKGKLGFLLEGNNNTCVVVEDTERFEIIGE